MIDLEWNMIGEINDWIKNVLSVERPIVSHLTGWEAGCLTQCRVCISPRQLTDDWLDDVWLTTCLVGWFMDPFAISQPGRSPTAALFNCLICYTQLDGWLEVHPNHGRQTTSRTDRWKPLLTSVNRKTDSDVTVVWHERPVQYWRTKRLMRRRLADA
jgi:hypothetical protein